MKFILSNFTLSFFILGLLTAAISLFRAQKPVSKAAVIEALFAHFLLFSVGISYLYNFVMHVFFAEMAARFIGWANSPFQYEVGYASLGFGLIGLLACRGNSGLRLAALLGVTPFLWGAAGGHLYQMIAAHDFSPGNAGIVFWTDIFLPVIGWLLFCKSKTTLANKSVQPV
ncbi:MAG: DUF6790 family protein [Limisphaerales bacterium]